MEYSFLAVATLVGAGPIFTPCAVSVQGIGITLLQPKLLCSRRLPAGRVLRD
jgi:hypothetical protein